MNKIYLKSLLPWTVMALFVSYAHAQKEIYEIDPVHSSVNFKVRHFFSPVPGNFLKFKGAIEVDREHPENNHVIAEIEVASVNTNNSKRDNHLRGEDFFDAEKFPVISFESILWKDLGNNQFSVTGNLKMHGANKPVNLSVNLLGFGKGSGNKDISGWEIKTTLNRSHFGISYGAPMVGDEVTVEIFIEARKKE